MEQRVKHTGKVGYTIQKQIIASTKATVDVVRLGFNPKLNVKAVNATSNVISYEKAIILPTLFTLSFKCLR